MISFGQLLILLFFLLLLFGDIRKIFNKFILFLVNLKAVLKKSASNQDNEKKS
jgi:hypothetical protein